MSDIVSGLDFIGGTRVSTSGMKREGGGSSGKNEKYLRISKPGEYRIRLIGGWVPFYSVWYDGGYKISPRSLLIELEKQDDNEEVHRERLHLKENGEPYSDEEAYCPLVNDPEKKVRAQLRYAINVIDRDEQERNPDGPVPVRILTGSWSIFKMFVKYRNRAHPWSPADPEKGPDFLIETAVKKTDGGKETTEYTVTNFDGPSPLTAQEKEVMSRFRSRENPDGVFNIMREYHPFKCPLSMAVETPYNPLFKEDKGSENSSHSSKVDGESQTSSSPTATQTETQAPSGSIPKEQFEEQISKTSESSGGSSVDDILAELDDLPA